MMAPLSLLLFYIPEICPSYIQLQPLITYTRTFLQPLAINSDPKIGVLYVRNRSAIYPPLSKADKRDILLCILWISKEVEGSWKRENDNSLFAFRKVGNEIGG
jgi:hypothetical protein